jgi:hypothetical protein
MVWKVASRLYIDDPEICDRILGKQSATQLQSNGLKMVEVSAQHIADLVGSTIPTVSFFSAANAGSKQSLRLDIRRASERDANVAALAEEESGRTLVGKKEYKNDK